VIDLDRLQERLRPPKEPERQYVREARTVLGGLLADADAAITELRLLLQAWEAHGCPVCGGDCYSANPPVSCCLMRQTRELLTFGAPTHSPVTLEAAARMLDPTGDRTVDAALSALYCCSGHECGCHGITVGEFLQHRIRSEGHRP
jgi:hypothetical protein